VARADAASATSCFPWPPPASPGRVDECPGVVPIRPTSLTLPLLPLSPFPTSPNTLALAPEPLPFVHLTGDHGQGEDGGAGACQEGVGIGEGEGEIHQPQRVLVQSPPAEGLGPRRLDPVDHHGE